MINDNYLNGAATLMAGGGYNVISYVAFGSTTGTITSADLITSGEFDRNAIVSATPTGNTVLYLANRNSTEGDNHYINVIGWHNEAVLASSGNLQANFLVASLLHTTAFDIECELSVTFNRV